MQMGRYKVLLEELDKEASSKGIVDTLDEVFELDEGVIVEAMSSIGTDSNVAEEDFEAYETVLQGLNFLQGKNKETLTRILEENNCESVTELFEKCKCSEDSKGATSLEEFLESLKPRVFPSGSNYALYNDGVLEVSKPYRVYDLLNSDVWLFDSKYNYKSLLDEFSQIWQMYGHLAVVYRGGFPADSNFLAKAKAILPCIDNEVNCNIFLNDFFMRFRVLEFCKELSANSLGDNLLLQVGLNLQPVTESFQLYSMSAEPDIKTTTQKFNGKSIMVVTITN